jgi:hypothetical protein
VNTIRAARQASGASYVSLAKAYGVHPTTIRMACVGLTWQGYKPVAIPPWMRQVPEFSSYFAGENGKIYSIRQNGVPREMALGVSGSGLKVFVVPDGAAKGRTVQLHDLVCAAWHGERPSAAHRVAHADGDRRNNAASNLSWMLRAKAVNKVSSSVGAHHRAKLTPAQVVEIRALAAAGSRKVDIAKVYQIHPYTVGGIVARKLWATLPDPDGGLPVVEALPKGPRVVLRGAVHGRARLTEDGVRGIRERFGVLRNKAAVAREFGVHPTTVTRIVTGAGWTHVL